MNLQIEQATLSDVSEVYKLEQSIEKSGSADLATLQSRYAMFAQGFMAARLHGKIVGYVESCVWNEVLPHFEARPGFFTQYHDLNASTLYLIFIGVDAQYRRQGIASKMISFLLDNVVRYDLVRMHAVCRDNHMPMYNKLGFSPAQELQGFLPDGGKYTLMEKLI